MTMANDHLLPMLANRIDYNPDCGTFVWRVSEDRGANWNSRYAGKSAGVVTATRHVTIGARHNGRDYRVRAHRLAWFIFYGKAPAAILDHIDGDGSNNRISNIRESPNSENQRNLAMSSRNTSGVSGVTWHKHCKIWQAQVATGSGSKYLGRFKNIADAEMAVRKHMAENGFTSRHGLPVMWSKEGL